MCTQQLEERIKITTRRKQLTDKAAREIASPSQASCNIQTSPSATFTPVTKRREKHRIDRGRTRQDAIFLWFAACNSSTFFLSRSRNNVAIDGSVARRCFSYFPEHVFHH